MNRSTDRRDRLQSIVTRIMLATVLAWAGCEDKCDQEDYEATCARRPEYTCMVATPNPFCTYNISYFEASNFGRLSQGGGEFTDCYPYQRQLVVTQVQGNFKNLTIYSCTGINSVTQHCMF